MKVLKNIIFIIIMLISRVLKGNLQDPITIINFITVTIPFLIPISILINLRIISLIIKNFLIRINS
jgi:hypothetical protein